MVKPPSPRTHVLQTIPLSSINKKQLDHITRLPLNYPLLESMEEEGQLQPITLNHKNQVIDGKNRVNAACYLGWKTLKAYKPHNPSVPVHLRPRQHPPIKPHNP